jgi:hypothetical protein
VALERRAVVLALVAEELAAALAGAALGHEQRPVVVTDLMAEVPEHGPVALAQLLAQGLAMRVVGLCHVERDHAGGVAGRDRRALAGEQLEGQAALALAPALHRQRELAELEEQPALGRLGDAELLERLGVVVGGSRAREPAARAQRPLARDEPVAAGRFEVGAAGGAGAQGDELVPLRLEPEV